MATKSWREQMQSGDWFLHYMSQLVEQGQSMGITVTVSGAVVSGLWVREQDYLDAQVGIVEGFWDKKLGMEVGTSVAQMMIRTIDMIRPTQGPTLDPADGTEIPPDPAKLPVPEFMHIKEDPAMKGAWWRIRIADVGAWSLGVRSRVP